MGMPEDYNPLAVEQEILEYWDEQEIHKKLKRLNTGKKKFYFLDGPPYTSGRIHLGQAWNKALKDMVLRYKWMNGFDVWDRAGYDMHGLPTEHKAEERLGLKTKEDIIAFGVEKFVEACRQIAVENMQLMNKDFSRLGVWMDFEHAYQSIAPSFIEGVWWLIKKAHEQGRLYEGEKSMHWCYHCATALAKHELEYKNKKDDSIFLKFQVRGKPNEFLLVWTTTPWTIAFNLGVMVNPAVTYVKAKVGDEFWYIAKALANVFISGVLEKKFEIVDEFLGEKLEGMPYVHPFADDLKPLYEPIQAKASRAFTVLLSAEYVDTSSGTGLVHTAPGCGPEDYEVGTRYKIPPLNRLDQYGVYDSSMGDFKGLHALHDNKKFIDALDKKGSLLAVAPVEHEYAHCWRCHLPVVFKTTKQWFFKVEDLRERMRAANKEIYWQPGWAGANWFDSWLENLRDNGVTRQRFWGTPFPVWKCSTCSETIVIGSAQELKKYAKKVPEDLHKPSLDKVTWKCTCAGTMQRIPDIMDVWIDAGSASWACLDFPQKRQLFDKWWPADFILEGKDQIRGWFNLLMVASMVSLGKNSYSHVFMHGFVQDAKGRKMSKSLGNVISPYEVVDRLGADTLRYYMVGGSSPGVDINYNEEDTLAKHKNLRVLWNLHNYLIDLAENSGVDIEHLKLREKHLGIEERFVLSKLNSTIRDVTGLFEQYRLNEVPWLVEDLYLAVSRSYIQMVREKVSSGSEGEKEAVVATLYYVLFESMKLLAPVTPFLVEKMFLSLKEVFKLKEESIHLHSWPNVVESYIDGDLEKNIAAASEVIQGVLAGREKIQRGLRWPMQEVIFTITDEKVIGAVEKLSALIKSQTNVKELRIQPALPGLKVTVKPDFSHLGPDFGKRSSAVVAKLVLESPETILRHLHKEGKFMLDVDGEKFPIVKEHVIVERNVPEHFVEVPISGGFAYLNKEVAPELEAEGFSRELVRRIQQLRKEKGLEKKDRVNVWIEADKEMVERLKPLKPGIKEKVGAHALEIDSRQPAQKYEFSAEEKIKGKVFVVGMRKEGK